MLSLGYPNKEIHECVRTYTTVYNIYIYFFFLICCMFLYLDFAPALFPPRMGDHVIWNREMCVRHELFHSPAP